ncbi:MAG TPA: GNAT family N-acetyltransferase [Micromonosporaceae bacterium]|nr:GNAT family N-acetyltransferase [Micromonosporaceae bacterium]
MGIRAVGVAELEILRGIERAAGECFRDLGLPEIADDEPLSVKELLKYQQAGRAWVAVDQGDLPVAYLIAELIDDNLHIEQVSVHPSHARRRVGRSLLEYAAQRALAQGVPALTLTTFAEVPWNAPYYLRCGFRILDESEWTPGLRLIRQQEAAHGLDRWPRLCMRRDL